MDMTGDVGTPLWRAPELLARDGKALYSPAADMYGFALCMWCLFHQDTLPFPNVQSLAELRHNILRGGRPPIRDDVIYGSAALKSLMERLWAKQPKARPTAAVALAELQDIARSMLRCGPDGAILPHGEVVATWSYTPDRPASPTSSMGGAGAASGIMSPR